MVVPIFMLALQPLKADENLKTAPGRVFVGIQPSVTVEPFYEKGEFDVNALPLIVEVPVAAHLSVRLAPTVNYHTGGQSNGISDLGLFVVTPIFLQKRKLPAEPLSGFYVGPVVGFGRNQMRDHYTITAAVEPGFLFPAERAFTIALGLQVGASYFTYDSSAEKWILHWGPKVTFGFWF